MIENLYTKYAFIKKSDVLEQNENYNPWSIINFSGERKLITYWANTSSNGLAGSLLCKGSKDIKMKFEELLQHRPIKSKIDEKIVFNQLGSNENVIWSLLLASGYLKVTDIEGDIYTLELTNYEVWKMFKNMVSDWFCENASDYNDFIKALLLGDVEAMNDYMNELTEMMFSSFDYCHKEGPTCGRIPYDLWLLAIVWKQKDIMIHGLKYLQNLLKSI